MWQVRLDSHFFLSFPHLFAVSHCIQAGRSVYKGSGKPGEK